ncbi:myosin heavy chain-like protein [Thalictrum thalictroides]|uniref:Myosin heavy chain-like protein n=1 Tax=Thalictrum thalictroides TaxID=46969 RepID=A0A7J6VDH1_THATH|nr:myosin heavy chain-like protein [Thalictrum thalictroides]
MDEKSNNNKNNNDGALVDRIQQLELERDELRKDIEQLCLQQAGPSYLSVVTRMHFQRTAGLEQEIENLKKKLAVCTRDNLNLHEELSEVYHIKSQLADLHSVEVSKNMEAEKQLKFFQGCVAAAFAERDNALMEAEKVKEREDFMSKEVNDFRERVEETNSKFLEEKKRLASLQIELTMLNEQNDNFQKVINKFYDIRQSFSKDTEQNLLEDKCECLLQDAPERWSFNTDMENSTAEYISGLEKELEILRNSVERHQNKMRMGLEIEDHLKRRVRELEKEKKLLYDTMKKKLSELSHSHAQHRGEVMDLLEHEKSQFKAMFDVVHERIKQLHENPTRDFGPPQGEAGDDDIECRDVHITTDIDTTVKRDLSSPIIVSEGTGDTSDALAQALKEKVAALLLLSQQDERHLLERNVNAAIQKKMEELQRNLLQVTNEKVKALMELAQLKQDYQILQENVSCGLKQGTLLPDTGDKSVTDHEKDGKLKNILKKTYLRNWINRTDFTGNDADINKSERNPNNKNSNYPIDFARMKIENATLKESIESMDHLTSSVDRLRRTLLKAKDSSTSSGSVTETVAVLNDIIAEAKLVKMALGNSLPVSWSAEAETGSLKEPLVAEPKDGCEAPSSEKLDSVSAAGFEMVELLILAAEILKESIIEDASNNES